MKLVCSQIHNSHQKIDRKPNILLTIGWSSPLCHWNTSGVFPSICHTWKRQIWQVWREICHYDYVKHKNNPVISLDVTHPCSSRFANLGVYTRNLWFHIGATKWVFSLNWWSKNLRDLLTDFLYSGRLSSRTFVVGFFSVHGAL